jgi:hypothetical protein
MRRLFFDPAQGFSAVAMRQLLGEVLSGGN